ncbi:hypothetical protein CDL15_Pgr007303 [Punica granatum]|uniref:Aminotransferase-like plant mobile domain-containing protein n=1 Tax=Punica granatum TaxID=22663 RepID=A0A218X7R5_PUNGR|nr:hypothetical protein CDL15_Pgr007303 [Punica granatum]
MVSSERQLYGEWFEVDKMGHNRVRARPWAKRFMGRESDIEHEAFLAMWLSRLILPQSELVMRNTSQQQYICREGLGDLSVLKKGIVRSAHSTRNYHTDDENDDALTFNLWALFQFIQVWVWDSIDSFQWCPYARTSENPKLHKFHPENEMRISVGSDTDGELLSFTRFLMPCELVELGNCFEQYLPHRLAMQFGMDQDLPSSVTLPHLDPKIAVTTFDRPITNTKVYIPPRVNQAGVATLHSKWWGEPKTSLKGCRAFKKDS